MAGAPAAARAARLRILLWRPAEDLRYDLSTGRGWALWLWKWLGEAALEFGGEEVKA